MTTDRFLHTMIRVGDLDRAIHFYTEVIGMKLIRKRDNPEYKYTLAFLGYDENGPQIELTYNWGTEDYEHGNAFGHLAIGVENVAEKVDKIKAAGGNVTREAGPVAGGSTIIAFVKDPDGYSIELIQNSQASNDLG